MKFDLRRPCKDCPFVCGSSTNQSLDKERLTEIVDDIENDLSFICHKTLGYDGKRPDHQHCAGALIYLERIGQYGKPNQAMRLGERLGRYDRSKLEMDFVPLIQRKAVQ